MEFSLAEIKECLSRDAVKWRIPLTGKALDDLSYRIQQGFVFGARTAEIKSIIAEAEKRHNPPPFKVPSSRARKPRS